VLEGITVGGKSLREHFEATNHRDAILFVEEIAGRTRHSRSGRYAISTASC
jgi:hypothetical protein